MIFPWAAAIFLLYYRWGNEICDINLTKVTQELLVVLRDSSPDCLNPKGALGLQTAFLFLVIVGTVVTKDAALLT